MNSPKKKWDRPSLYEESTNILNKYIFLTLKYICCSTSIIVYQLSIAYQRSSINNSTTKKQSIKDNRINDNDELAMWWWKYHTHGIFDPWKMEKFCNYLFKLCNTFALFMHVSNTLSLCHWRHNRINIILLFFFNRYREVLYVIDHEWNAKNVQCVIK